MPMDSAVLAADLEARIKTYIPAVGRTEDIDIQRLATAIAEAVVVHLTTYATPVVPSGGGEGTLT